VHLELDGYPVTLLDTAGIRDSDDPVEQEGVRRARERAAGADLVLWVVDATAPEAAAVFGEGGASVVGRGHPVGRPMADLGGGSEPVESPPVWVVRNKADLLASVGASGSDDAASPAGRLTARPSKATTALRQSRITEFEFISSSMNSSNSFTLSATDGKGVNSLLDHLSVFTSQYFGSEPALVSRERQRRALGTTQAALDRALAEGPEGGDDIVAEELRFAATALGRLTGRVDVEDILDVIFADFCIGK
jgi:tRNA modification GTPase